MTTSTADTDDAPAPVPATTPAKPSLVSVATKALEGQFETFASVVPAGINEKRFQQIVLSVVKSNRELIACFGTVEGRTSLILSALQCAALGLEPNTPLHEASILPRKLKGRQEAQLMVEYRGLIKLARRSGELSNIFAEVVHAGDEFAYTLGLEPTLHHVPSEDDDPGELTHAYAVVKFKDGTSQFVVLPKRVIESQHRAHSDSWRNESSRPYSPWTKHTEAMWRKTAVRALEPYLPLTADARFSLAAPEAVTLRMDDVDGGHITYDHAIDVKTGEVLPLEGGE